jgi:hypothetical protein
MARRWTQAGPGSVAVEDRALHTQGGMGGLGYAAAPCGDCELTLAWKATRRADNAGVFVRFPDPLGAPRNAVAQGYEVPIDDLDAPDGAAIHTTGAISGVQPPLLAASRAPGEWHAFVLRAVGQPSNVTRNGQRVIVDVLGTRLRRGFIGLQHHGVRDVVSCRTRHVGPLETP